MLGDRGRSRTRRTRPEAVDSQLRALSTRTRLLLLDLLIQQERSRCVCDLLPSFARDQPTISHYLRTLLVAGFVDTEKRSIWAHPFRTASK